jgi:hypothetical protein
MTEFQQAFALFALVYWAGFGLIVYVIVQGWRAR